MKTINRSDIARAVGVDVAHISRIFSGKSNPSLDLAVKISGHLGITLDKFYLLINPKTNPKTKTRK